MNEQVVADLIEALKECADDLAQEIEHRCGDALGYPGQRRRYGRDMAPVLRARALIDATRAMSAIKSRSRDFEKIANPLGD
jgi:hypothetical protein